MIFSLSSRSDPMYRQTIYQMLRTACMAFTLISALVLLALFSNHILSLPTVIQLTAEPGGDYRVYTDPSRLGPREVFKGNPVIRRRTFLSSGARKAWIDLEQTLTRGVLRQYLFYTTNSTNATLATIRLQVWRPVPDETRRFTLVWQYIARDLNYRSSTGILWRVSSCSFQHLLFSCSNCTFFPGQDLPARQLAQNLEVFPQAVPTFRERNSFFLPGVDAVFPPNSNPVPQRKWLAENDQNCSGGLGGTEPVGPIHGRISTLEVWTWTQCR